MDVCHVKTSWTKETQRHTEAAGGLVSGLFIQSFNFLFQKPLLKNEKGVI